MSNKDAIGAFTRMMNAISEKIDIYYKELETADEAEALEFRSKIEALQEIYSDMEILKKDCE